MNLTKSQLVDRILKKPNTMEMMVLEKVLRFLIPFNGPHSFKMAIIDEGQVSIKLPYKRVNMNHLKGIHACALATLGEFCAGLSLIKQFPFSKYRPILKSLHSDYTYQAKTDVIGTILIDHERMNQVKEELKTADKVTVNLVTIIVNTEQKEVARITTEWQIKSWEKVKTKI
jgi:acyl-coenzyme A thioesterase PaaI-like protein